MDVAPDIAFQADLMAKAIEAAKRGIAAGQSPFGAVVATKTGAVVVEAHNTVRSSCDSTAHAEITAIRQACQQLGTTNLAGHLIVSTCEPCPMCTAAIHWSRLDAIVYGASIADAKRMHFNELSISAKQLLEQGHSFVRIYPRIRRDQCLELFEIWREGPNPHPY